MTEIQDIRIDNRLTRTEQIAALRERDGSQCRFPDCREVLDFSITSGPLEITIDHWMPQYWCKQNDWTYEEMWDLSNLRLMHKRCNAKKGDRIPNDDGTLPEKAVRKFRYRRDKRAGRPEFCEQCDNGHYLDEGEICASCGCNAQRFPSWRKVRLSECDHAVSWCMWCSIGVIERTPAFETALRQGMSGGDDYGDESEET